MFGVGFIELLIIAVFALVFVGSAVPEVMRQAGRLFVHLRRTANDVRSTFDQVIRDAEDELRREEAVSLRDALQPTAGRSPRGHSPLTGPSLRLRPRRPCRLVGGARCRAPAPPPSPLQVGQTPDITSTACAEATPSTPAVSVPKTPGGGRLGAPARRPDVAG